MQTCKWQYLGLSKSYKNIFDNTLLDDKPYSNVSNEPQRLITSFTYGTERSAVCRRYLSNKLLDLGIASPVLRGRGPSEGCKIQKRKKYAL